MVDSIWIFICLLVDTFLSYLSVDEFVFPYLFVVPYFQNARYARMIFR